MCSVGSGEGLAFEGKVWVGLLTGAPPGPDTRDPMSCAQHRRGVGAADGLTWVTQTLYPDRPQGAHLAGCRPGSLRRPPGLQGSLSSVGWGLGRP